MQGVVVGILLTVLLLSATMVYANSRVTREITYGINVMLNGEMVQFDYDSRPFVMDGRTFLPLRTLAELVGLPVDFDPATNTAIIGSATQTPAPSEVEVMLFNQQHASVGNASGLRIEGNALSNTIQLWGQHGDGASLPDNGWMTSNYISYSLNGTATRFMATLNPPGTRGRADVTYRVYGDGRLLFESYAMTANVLPVDVNIDVAGITTLRIEVILVTRTRVHPFEVLGQNTNHRGIENARIITN